MSLADEIVDVVRPHLESMRIGSNEVTAFCPFHHAKTPGRSFGISRETGLWNCFSCHESGNLRTFLKAIGVSHELMHTQYGRLLEEAARAVPSKLDPLRPNVLARDPLPESLLGIFHHVPVELERQGFTEETLNKFDVGFDLHHGRITFPLRDLAGQLVGISGRALYYDELTPKYKVYDREYKTWGLPERLGAAAERRNVLWNIDRLILGMRGVLYPPIVLVEGFKACMWVDQAGVKNVSALIGSFMTEQQQWILESIGAQVYLMLDNNEAGQKGTKRIGKRLSRGGLDVFVVQYRPGDEEAQPDDLSVDEVHEAIDAATTFYRWLHPH